jgi:hypothetical protein
MSLENVVINEKLYPRPLPNKITTGSPCWYMTGHYVLGHDNREWNLGYFQSIVPAPDPSNWDCCAVVDLEGSIQIITVNRVSFNNIKPEISN